MGALCIGAGCTGDDGVGVQPPTVVSAETTTTLPATRTVPAGTVPATAPGSTDASAPTCQPRGDTAPVENGFSGRYSQVFGSDIRTGHHGCFERIVLEFIGDGDLPGYRVAYADGPVTLGESGETVELRGDADLLITANAWMGDPAAGYWTDPIQIFPDNVDAIQELYLTYNFEGQLTWAVGLDVQRRFQVTTLTDELLIVVDIAL